MDTYIELVKTDIVNNLKNAKKLNLATDEIAIFQSLLHNDNMLNCKRNANVLKLE